MKQSLQIWLEAARPKTLPLALVSILTGSVLAYSAGHFSLTIAIMAFVTATLLQILSNLANDYGDAVQGTDNDKRLGPLRAMQSGAVSAKQMKQAIIFNIVLTAISGLVLVFYSLSSLESIVTFIGLGILAILAAIAYTMGSKPYGYVGLGDISVFLFFGLLGVSGTYFLHTGHVDTTLFLPALAAVYSPLQYSTSTICVISRTTESVVNAQSQCVWVNAKPSSTTLFYLAALFLPLRLTC